MRIHRATITCSAAEGRHIRDFSVGVRILACDYSHVTLSEPICVEKPSRRHFTDIGIKVINALFSVDGVIAVTAYQTALSVEVRRDLDGEALESVFLQIIMDRLFPDAVFRTHVRKLVSCDEPCR